MEQQDQIITIKEARKLLEGKARRLSDDQVEELINQLDFIATLAINQYKAEHAEEKSGNEAIKEQKK